MPPAPTEDRLGHRHEDSKRVDGERRCIHHHEACHRAEHEAADEVRRDQDEPARSTVGEDREPG